MHCFRHSNVIQIFKFGFILLGVEIHIFKLEMRKMVRHSAHAQLQIHLFIGTLSLIIVLILPSRTITIYFRRIKW